MSAICFKYGQLQCREFLARLGRLVRKHGKHARRQSGQAVQSLGPLEFLFQ